VPPPSDSHRRDYAFERTVTFREADGTASTGFIDLYKKGCFVLGEALQTRRGDISIPVYLGDAMQLSVSGMMAGRELVIQVPAPEPAKGNGAAKNGNSQREMLRFPETVCRDPHLLDNVVDRMRLGSENRQRPEAFGAAVKALGVSGAELEELIDTYRRYDDLRNADRNTIWSYVARNLSRPLYLSAEERRVDVLVGNPPWLSLRHMSDDLHKRFKDLANGERIYVGRNLATQNDLSALFFVRSVALYLKPGGRVAFVMPLAAMTRGQFEKFRKGHFHTRNVQFTDGWVLDDDVQPLFPVPSCVLFARGGRGLGKPLPDTVRRFSGDLPYRDASEAVADEHLKVDKHAARPTEASYKKGSPYRNAFHQGATLVPRMLCLVKRVEGGRIGTNPRMPLVESRRSRQEKQPWKSLDKIEHGVEAEFVRPVLLGESILPFRVFREFEGVLPVDAKGSLLDADTASRLGKSGLAGWMGLAEDAWEKHKTAQVSLVGQFDYYGKLGSQFPIPPLRVVYAASGTILCALVINDQRMVIEHAVYWAAVKDRREALYLASVLGSEAAREKVETLQARGQWGARHFDKVMFTLPIPRFDAGTQLHSDLAAAGAEAETVAASVALPDGIHFQTARRRVREALTEVGISKRIDALVAALLP
jgi:hypothetical protein